MVLLGIKAYFVTIVRKGAINLMIANNQSTPIQKKTYTIDEIATQLNISMKSAYTLAKSGVFHYVRAGRAIRVSKESFDRWLNEQI